MATAVVSTEVASNGWRQKLPERLPDLSGKSLALYTVVWAIMLPLAIIGPVRGSYQVYGYLSKPAWIPYGVQLQGGSDDARVPAALTDEARRAGVRPGDRIVAIDDWKIPSTAAAIEDARVHLIKPEGATTVFALVGADGTARRVQLTYSYRHIEEVYRGSGLSIGSNIAALIAGNLLECLGMVAAAVLLFIRERRQAVPALLSLGFLMLSVAPYGNEWSWIGISPSIVVVESSIAFSLMLAALLAFPDGRLSSRWVQLALVALPVLPIVVATSPSLLALELGVSIFCTLAVVALVARYRRLPEGAERQQMRWVFFGFVTGMVLLIVSAFLSILGLRLSAVDARWYAWGSILPLIVGVAAALAFTGGLIVSVLKYRLYDADTVIGRSAAYGVLTVGFVGLFAGAEKLSEIVGERYFEHSIGIAAGAIGAAVAAVCIVPLHNRVHRWAERRFQKPLIRLREGLPECVADLRESSSVEQLASAVMKRVEAGVRSTREAVLLADKGKLALAGARGVSAKALRAWQRGWISAPGDGALDCARADPLFPLRVRLCIDSGGEPETIGWLLLGPRPDGSFFSKDEREALEHVAGPVARAIHIAQLREHREADAERRLGALETLVASVTDALKGHPPGASMA